MNKYNYALLLIIATSLAFQSCEKNSSDPKPVIPADTVVSFLPSKLVYESMDPEESKTATITYSLAEHTIKFEVTHPTSTSQSGFPKRFTYYYSADGYLMQKEVFDNNGALVTRFIVDRDNGQVIKRLLVENNGVPANDTFNVAFIDSLTTGYRRMHIDNASRSVDGHALKTMEDFTFFNEKLKVAVREQYSDGQSQLNPLKVFLAYDENDRLIEETSPAYSKDAAYSYETSSTGLDSFYNTLEGRDGYYLTRFNWWPSFVNNDFYFEPLWLALHDNMGVQMVPEIHRFGVLKQARSGAQNWIFDFANTLDSNSRIIESKITRNGVAVGTYRVSY